MSDDLATVLVSSKRGVLEALLAEDGVAYLSVRPDAGAVVPAAIAASASVRLRIGRDLKPPIPDLLVDRDGVRATLAFPNGMTTCVIPWRALWSVSNLDADTAFVWEEDAPPGVRSDLERRREDTAAEAGTELEVRAEPTRPRLSLVPMPEDVT